MKQVIILSLCVSLALVSCCREELPECTSGTLRLVNGSDKPITFSVGGKMGTIEGKSYKKFELNADQDIHIKVEQDGGFLQGPTVKDWNLRIAGCQDTLLIFPD